MGIVIKMKAHRRHGRAPSASDSAGSGTIPHRDVGAAHPHSRKADCITTKVSAGNRTKLRQLNAAPYERPVNLATDVTPPSASMTSEVVVSSRTMDVAFNPNFLDSQHPNLIDTRKFGHPPCCGTMANAGKDDDPDVALRCRALVRIYAMVRGKPNSKKFAELIEVSPTRWNNIEGTGQLSRDVARHICRRYPEVSLDWLYRGRDDGMPRQLSDEFLSAYREELTAARPAPKTSRRKRRAA